MPILSAYNKLVKKGVPKEVAQKLVDGGLQTPKKVRGATISKIREVTGLSSYKATRLRAALTR